jgi:hypothetical protein
MANYFPGFLARSKQRKALNRLAFNLDVLTNMVEVDYTQRRMAWLTVERFISLLRQRRISEARWQNLLMRLLEADLLGPSSPLYLWCRRCPGVGFTVSTIPLDCNLPPFCPSCGRFAQAISTFTPVGLLREAMSLTDGVLGAAVGWYIRQRHIRFRPALQLGGTEYDFLVRGPRGLILLECKMHQVLSPGKIGARLLGSRTQLRKHIGIAQTASVNLQHAACVVNVEASHLQKTLRQVKPELDAEYKRVGATLLSYEDLPTWLERVCGIPQQRPSA